MGIFKDLFGGSSTYNLDIESVALPVDGLDNLKSSYLDNDESLGEGLEYITADDGEIMVVKRPIDEKAKKEQREKEERARKEQREKEEKAKKEQRADEIIEELTMAKEKDIKERGLLLKAGFDNYLESEGTIGDILINQYGLTLQKMNGQPVIYADDVESFTSGAVFDINNHYDNYIHLTDYEGDDFRIARDFNIYCFAYSKYVIDIEVKYENIEEFMKEYVTPIVVVNSGNKISIDDIPKILDKGRSEILKESRIVPFFFINMIKLIKCVNDKILEKLAVLDLDDEVEYIKKQLSLEDPIHTELFSIYLDDNILYGENDE